MWRLNSCHANSPPLSPRHTHTHKKLLRELMLLLYFYHINIMSLPLHICRGRLHTTWDLKEKNQLLIDDDLMTTMCNYMFFLCFCFPLFLFCFVFLGMFVLRWRSYRQEIFGITLGFTWQHNIGGWMLKLFVNKTKQSEQCCNNNFFSNV